MHIILFVVDALRSDHLSCYGYEREITSNIEQFSRDGVLFENCYTPSTWTRPVAASIFTGNYPGTHGVITRQDGYTKKHNGIAEILMNSGFQTSAFSGIGQVSQETGFNVGFEEFVDLFKDEKVKQARNASKSLSYKNNREVALPRAEDVNYYLFPWLEKHSDENTFTLCWAIDTHDPYSPPNGFNKFGAKVSNNQPDRLYRCSESDKEKLINLYDGEILYFDYCFGELINKLKSLDIYHDSMIVLTSDHGEAFYEHGFYSHGTVPYEELLRVPLIIKFPEERKAGKRIHSLTQLTDLLPTILNVAKIDYDEMLIQGKNLISLINNGIDEIHPFVFSETQSLPFLNKYYSIQNSKWKYICTQKPERSLKESFSFLSYFWKRKLWIKIFSNPVHLLKRHAQGEDEKLFDLQNDPTEMSNLAMENPERLEMMRAELEKHIEKNSNLAEEINNNPMSLQESEILKQHLEDLGYF